MMVVVVVMVEVVVVVVVMMIDDGGDDGDGGGDGVDDVWVADNRLTWYGVAMGVLVGILLIVLDEAVSTRPLLQVM